MQETVESAKPTAPVVGIKGKNIGGLPVLRQQLRLQSAEIINGLGAIGEDKSLDAKARLDQAEAAVDTLDRIARVLRVLDGVIDGPRTPAPKGAV